MRGVNGPVPRPSDVEREELARITSADIERARQTWEQSASPRFRTLLDATPLEASFVEPPLIELWTGIADLSRH
jgi:hypothetical protein